LARVVVSERGVPNVSASSGFVRASQIRSAALFDSPVSGTLVGFWGGSSADEERENEEMSKRVYVGNLSFATTETTLRDLFGQAGTVAEVKVMLDRETGRPRGFAFVEMGSESEAQAAVAQFNSRELEGRQLKVDIAAERTGGGGGGGGGGRSGGGRPGGGGGGRGRW
jgi:cold-inducible RNA-binding protein